MTPEDPRYGLPTERHWQVDLPLDRAVAEAERVFGDRSAGSWRDDEVQVLHVRVVGADGVDAYLAGLPPELAARVRVDPAAHGLAALREVKDRAVEGAGAACSGGWLDQVQGRAVVLLRTPDPELEAALLRAAPPGSLLVEHGELTMVLE